jgi:hypothetical protein
VKGWVDIVKGWVDIVKGWVDIVKGWHCEGMGWHCEGLTLWRFDIVKGWVDIVKGCSVHNAITPCGYSSPLSAGPICSVHNATMVFTTTSTLVFWRSLHLHVIRPKVCWMTDHPPTTHTGILVLGLQGTVISFGRDSEKEGLAEVRAVPQHLVVSHLLLSVGVESGGPQHSHIVNTLSSRWICPFHPRWRTTE